MQEGIGRAVNAYLFAECFQLFSVDVVPYQLHIVPVRDDAMFEGIFYLQQPSQLLCPLSNEGVAF